MRSFSSFLSLLLACIFVPPILGQVTQDELAPLLAGLAAIPPVAHLSERVPLSTDDPTVTPLVDLQVFQPPVAPQSGTSCSVQLLNHSFGVGSYNSPAIVPYSPPTDSNCGAVGRWAAISLNLTVYSIGTQYDRLSAIYLSHVEIWRSSSAEPTKTGTIWITLKDATVYSQLFASDGDLMMDFGNIVDDSLLLDGVFDVTLTATFYAPSKQHPTPRTSDVIIPLSNLSPTVGNFFTIENDAGGVTAVSLPDTTTDAYVQVYCSGNSAEEFWYTNTPDEFVDSLPAGVIGKGPFREVQVWVDTLLAGVVWPSPVFYTGGVTPTNWRPLTAYGTYDQPTYWIDITPFLPVLLSDKDATHNVTLRVLGQGTGPSINSNWFVSGSIHARLGNAKTSGKMITHDIGGLNIYTSGSATEGNVTVNTKVTATRHIKIASVLHTSEGNKTVTFEQNLSYSNVARYADQGWWVDQLTEGTTVAQHAGKTILRDAFTYPLSLFSNYSLYSQENGSYGSEINQTFTRALQLPMAASSVIRSVQHAEGSVLMDNWPGLRHAISGQGATDQTFGYTDSTGATYFRDIAAKNDGWVKDIVWGSLKDANPPVPPSQIFGPGGGPGFRRSF